MANMNFRDLFPFDESGSTNPAPGGLPGLLQQVMPQWRPPPSLLGADPASLFQQPGRAFDAQQLQALARRDQFMQPLSSDPVDVDAGSPRDPNFRQLISRPQRNNQLSAGDQAARSSGRPVQVAAAPDLQKIWSLLNEPSVEVAQPSTDARPNSETIPAGAACFPTPGQGVSLGKSIWPLPGEPLPQDQKSESITEHLSKFFSNIFTHSSSVSEDHQKCLEAVKGGKKAWKELCNSLPQTGQNNVVGGESIRRACWAKYLEPKIKKKQWCDNQFGNN